MYLNLRVLCLQFSDMVFQAPTTNLSWIASGNPDDPNGEYRWQVWGYKTLAACNTAHLDLDKDCHLKAYVPDPNAVDNTHISHGAPKRHYQQHYDYSTRKWVAN